MCRERGRKPVLVYSEIKLKPGTKSVNQAFFSRIGKHGENKWNILYVEKIRIPTCVCFQQQI